MSSKPDFVADRLNEVRRLGRFRAPPVVQHTEGVRACVEGQQAVVFCSNDYLGLRSDPRLLEAGHMAAERAGAGSGSSRLIAGSLPIHQALEEELAEWIGSEAALVCSSGYQANLALLQGVTRAGDQILSDSLNHASIIDGCRLSRAEVAVVKHGEPDALRTALCSPVEGARFMVLEGLYSMDGDRGAVAAWARAAEEGGAHLIIDEAHSLGVFGPAGTGVAAEQGVASDCFARVGTFGKSFGSHGAFVACSRATRDLLVNSGRTYIFTTGLPPFSVGAALAALKILRSNEGAELAGRVAELAGQLRRGLKGLGLQVLGDEDSPIVPVVVGPEERSMALSRGLLQEGFYAMAIRPPTVAEGTCRLRFTVSAAHDRTMVEGLVVAAEKMLASL